MIKYNLPLFIQMNVDENGDRVSTEILNEQVKVINNTTFLSAVPDEYYRVNIGGSFVEIDISEEITSENQYKCSYQTGQIWFHSSRSGETIKVARYYSYGVIFYPSDRIYTETSGGSVTQTLQDVINTAKMTWKAPVSTYSSIIPTYPSPSESWTVQTLDNNKIYRYDGTTWQWIQTINVTNAFIKNSDTSDNITQGTTNLFVTSAEKATWNGGSLNATSFGTFLNGLTEKTTPVDADMVGVMDSEATNISKKLSWANIKSNILSYINTATATFTNKTLTSPVISTIVNTGTLTLPTTTGTLVGRTTTDTLTNKTLTAPKMTSASYIADSNGNELIKFPSSVASAVNEITVSNAITGSSPTIEPTGGDTNISLNLKSKGTGTVQVNGYDILTANTNTTVTPTVSLGMNSVIKKTNGVESFPKITMTGKSQTNILGKDGNCEDISKWTPAVCSLALDATNRVFGNNGIKVTLASTAGNVYKDIFSQVTPSKYYLISAYLKNGNATNIVGYLYSNGVGQTSKPTAVVTNTAGFTRVAARYKPTDWGTGASWLKVEIDLTGANGQYAYMDGIMVTEYPASDDALTDAQLLEKYPYVDSYACLENPYIEVRHDNLVRNGNGEEGIGLWTPNPAGGCTLAPVSGGGLSVTTTAGNWAKQIVQVKANTDYYLSGIGTNGGTVRAFDTAIAVSLRSGVGTFNTGANTQIAILLFTAVAVTSVFTNVQLIEGTVAPASYKTCRIERCVIEGKFTSDDTFVLENGEVTGLLNWKHKTLFGKDVDWQYLADDAGYKRIRTTSLGIGNANGLDSNSMKSVKYDGKPLLVAPTLNGVTADRINWYSTGELDITIPDTDTGWAEAIAPNADEVKAFMNGWKAVYNNGTRYLTFISVLDGSAPSGALKTAVTSGTTGTTINVTAGTGTQYTAGDVISIIRGVVYISSVTVSSVTANTIVVNVSSTVVTGDVIIKADTTTSIPLLTYCKNNIAPNYEGYQLHYKLQNPEPITDVNTHIHGDIPKLDNGENYLFIDYGMVLGEAIIPFTDATNAYVNSSSNIIKNRVDIINSVYKNMVNDNWIYTASYNSIRGNGYAAIPVANFDTNAAYTVDYQILKTMHTSPTTLTCSYQQDIISSVESLSNISENKQNSDASLNDYIDKSKYEDKVSTFSAWRAVSTTTGYVDIYFPFIATKKTVPRATIKSTSFTINGSTDTTFVLDSIAIKTDMAVLTFKTTNTVTVSNLKSYGVGAVVRALFESSN